jgi:hypothetical protein
MTERAELAAKNKAEWEALTADRAEMIAKKKADEAAKKEARQELERRLSSNRAVVLSEVSGRLRKATRHADFCNANGRYQEGAVWRAYASWIAAISWAGDASNIVYQIEGLCEPRAQSHDNYSRDYRHKVRNPMYQGASCSGGGGVGCNDLPKMVRDTTAAVFCNDVSDEEVY